MKGLITALIVGSIVCASVVLLVLTTGDGLSAAELKVDRGWEEIVPTDALKQPQQVQDELDISEAVVRFTIAKGYSRTSLLDHLPKGTIGCVHEAAEQP